MQDFSIHLLIRALTVFFIFSILGQFRKRAPVEGAVIRLWYLIGISQSAFLFYVFVKELRFPFPLILLTKFLWLGFGYYLWLFSKTAVNPNFRISAYTLLPFFAVQFFGLTATRLGNQTVLPNGIPVSETVGLFFGITSVLLEALLAAAALRNIYISCRTEMQNSMLFIKKFFLASAATGELMILAVILISRGEDLSVLRMWVVSLFHFSFVFTAFLLFHRYPFESSKRKIEKDADLDQSFSFLMNNDKSILYNDITLKDLSEKMNVPQYRLRTYINEKLGFGNFNQFLNYYRIEEACRLMKSEDHSKTPVSRIGLIAGFSSNSTFIRVFKELKGKSPGEYKKSLIA